MGFCTGVDENFQHHFVVSIGYCITDACITNSITMVLPYKSIYNNHDIFHDEITLIFFINTIIAKPHVKILSVPVILIEP